MHLIFEDLYHLHFFQKHQYPQKYSMKIYPLIELLIILFFLFCLSNISSKFCFDELITTSFDLKLFFIKLIEFGKIENIKLLLNLVNNVLKKFILFIFFFFFFFHFILISL